MAISTNNLLAAGKTWYATLTIGAREYEVTDFPSRTLGTNQSRGTCSVKTAVFPEGAAGEDAFVTIWLNGQSERFFTGKVDVRPISDNPPSFEVSLTDIQNLTVQPLGVEVVWNNVSFSSAVRGLLNAAGIDNGRIASIFDPGGDFTLGPNYGIVIPQGTEINGVIRNLMDFAGTQLVVETDGSIHVRDAPGWPSEAPTTVYAYGASKTEGEFGIIGSRRSIAGAESVVASFRAKGPRRPDRKIPNAIFQLVGTVGKSEEQEYPYVQTDACASAIAEREIVRRNRQSTEVEITAPLNPYIRHGDSLWYRNPIEGWSDKTAALVLSTSTSGAQMTLLISVGARPAAGETSSIPPPVANFTLLYEVQPISLQGIMAPRYLVQAINTSTDPSGFRITSIEWTAKTSDPDLLCSPEKVSWKEDDTAEEPTNKNKKGLDPHQPIFVFPSLEGATLTLVVESSSGQGAEKVQAIVPPASMLFTRTLAYAAPSGWHILVGAEGWRSFGDNCTAVPGINDVGPLLGGFQNGKLYRTEDWLETAPELLYTFSDAVRCIFVNEINYEEILVGVGTVLHRSQDGGIGWTAVTSFPGNINYCESSGANPDEIRVCADDTLWFSSDGETFEPLLVGPAGATCRKVASAPWGHLAVWSGNGMSVTGEPEDRPWRFEEELELNWSGVDVADRPSDFASVTPMQYQEGFILAAGACSDIIRDGLFGQLTYAALIPGTTRFYKVGADRNVSLVGEAEEGGPAKMVLHSKTYPIAEDTSCLRIGYGQTTDSALPPKLVVLPNNQNTENDRILIYEPDLATWIERMPPIPLAPWQGIAISPTKPDTWIIWAGISAFVTQNAGLSWVQIYLPVIYHWSHYITDAVFIDGDTWLVAAFYSSRWGASVSTQGYFTKGQAGSTTATWTYGNTIVSPAAQGSYRGLFNLARGVNGEAFGHLSDVPGVFLGGGGDTPQRIGYVTGTSVFTGSVVIGPGTVYALQAAEPNSRAAWGVWSNNLARTPDYRSVAPTPIIAAGGSVGYCRLGVVVGNRTGVAIIDNLSTTPTVRVVAGGDGQVGKIAIGSRGRVAAAVSLTPQDGSYRIYAHNGSRWTMIETPPGFVISDRIGIPER